jgi:hypothetical protein
MLGFELENKLNSDRNNSLSSPITHLRRYRGERRYSSYSFTTSALKIILGDVHNS